MSVLGNREAAHREGLINPARSENLEAVGDRNKRVCRRHIPVVDQPIEHGEDVYAAGGKAVNVPAPRNLPDIFIAITEISHY